MTVATFLSPADAARLRGALAGTHEIISADSFATLDAIIRGAPITVVVLDPTIDSRIGVPAAEKLIGRYSSLPFLAFVHVNAESMTAVARLARAGLYDVVVMDSADALNRLKEKIDTASFSPLTGIFLGALQPELEKLPPNIAQTVRSLFQAPDKYVVAKDIAAASSVTMTCLYRTFQTAEVSRPKKFLMAARLLRGYKFLLDQSCSVELVAAKTGYANARAFSRHTRMVFGVSPSALRRSLRHDDVINDLHGWLIGAKPRRRRSSRLPVRGSIPA
jgi:AraC-like DNA-binding protein